jgi:hypothetical protein
MCEHMKYKPMNEQLLHYIFMSNVFSMPNICVQNIWTYELTNFTKFPLLNHWMLNL